MWKLKWLWRREYKKQEKIIYNLKNRVLKCKFDLVAAYSKIARLECDLFDEACRADRAEKTLAIANARIKELEKIIK